MGRVSDLVDVRRADALLDGHDAPGWRLRRVDVVGFELLHARRREQHAGVALDDQRGAGQVQVAVALEVADELLPDLVRIHR